MASDTVASMQKLAKSPPTDEKERADLYNAAMDLMYSVESKQNTQQRLYHGHLPLATAQTGIDLNLFKFLAENPESEFATGELAQITGADPVLLYRLLRFYAAHGMVRQSNTDTFTASNITHNLALPGSAQGIKHYSLTMTPAYNAIPKYLAKNSYKNPSDSAVTPFNLAYNTDMPVFKWREHNPENAKVGQAFMAAQRIGQRSVWDGLVPLDDFKLSEEDLGRDRVMMCDVGGGTGHQCLEFRKYQPSIEGRIVTEDLSAMHKIGANRKELEKNYITLVSHDFMSEQPIHGAKVYYLRNVIHNWMDEPSKVILGQISKVMVADSILIVDDVVMPEMGSTWKQASMDLAMMTMLAALERTKEHFGRLFKEVGLQLRDVWTYDKEYGDSFIVAVPAPGNKRVSTNGITSLKGGVVNGVNGS